MHTFLLDPPYDMVGSCLSKKIVSVTMQTHESGRGKAVRIPGSAFSQSPADGMISHLRWSIVLVAWNGDDIAIK